MRLRRRGLAAIFAIGLIAVYFSRTGWLLYTALVVGVSMLGGWAIGRRWAVGVAVGVNVAFSAFALIALTLHFGVQSHGHPTSVVALVFLGQVLVSASATAAALRLRSAFANRFAKPSSGAHWR